MAQAGRTFRVFVSSTFEDLKEERNALQTFVFPRLRELCARHGCRLQAIDLRWGCPRRWRSTRDDAHICADVESSRWQCDLEGSAHGEIGVP